MKYKTVYMHTLDGLPAFYEPNKQVCYLGRGNGRAIEFPSSLKELREEWRKSEQWRVKKGFGPSTVRSHSYARFRIALPGSGEHK